MGIISKIEKMTNCSHFSICKMEKDKIAIDLWELNQTYKIDLNDNNVYFDTEHSDEPVDFGFVNKFLSFLEENKGFIV